MILAEYLFESHMRAENEIVSRGDQKKRGLARSHQGVIANRPGVEMRLLGVAFACLPSCLSSSLPRYYPRANRTQGSWRASERLLRGWGRRDWSRIKGSLAISCLSSHLISEKGDCGGGGVRGNCRTSMFARPFSDAAVAMSVMAADDGRASDRWRIGHRRRRTGCGPDGRWMADGQTQREGEEFSLYDMLPLE